MDRDINTEKKDYWSAVAEKWKKGNPQRLWRIYADTLNSGLIAGCLSSSPVVDLLLKTDMFDEAFGTGLISALHAKSRRIIGIDIAHGIVNAACSRNSGIGGINADVRLMPFRPGTFDIVLSISSLDHFRTRQEIISALEETRRILKPGGTLVITMDNPMNPLVALRNMLPFSLLNSLGIVPYYVGATAGSHHLSRILENAGFRVTGAEAVMHFPRILGVALAGILDRYADRRADRLFLRFLMAFEHISRLPTRFVTGHYVAIKAVKS